VLGEYGIVEMVRTGAVAMLRSAHEVIELQEIPRTSAA
jgi:Small subunit of acetolactate synthase